MSIDRPRRIFRPNYHPLAPRRLGVLVIVAAAIVGLALAAIEVAGVGEQPSLQATHGRR